MMNINEEKPDPLFWVDDLLTMIGVVLLLFSLYIAPFVLLDKVYPVPEFILHFAQWLHESTTLSMSWQKVVIFLPFIVPSLLCFYCAKLMTDYIEAKEDEKAAKAAKEAQTPKPETELSDAGDIKPD